jgi:hypothetical protein
MDDPGVNPALVVRSLADVARANRLFGGSRAVLNELKHFLDSCGVKCVTLLDVGTGLADIPRTARGYASKRGVELVAVGMDNSEASLRARCDPDAAAVCGDALRLPFGDAAVDIVTCSQVLHHFSGQEAGTLLRELDRVARMRVIVADIRRSWLAAAGIWLASFPLRFHPVSRHDGVVSVLRGFTPGELTQIVSDESGHEPRVQRHPGFRITASWAPGARA